MSTQLDSLDFLTVNEIAEQLRLTAYSVRSMLTDGTLKGYKLKGAWRVRREDLLAWINDRSNQKPDQ